MQLKIPVLLKEFPMKKYVLGNWESSISGFFNGKIIFEIL
jgi:hypothetical protein